MDDGRKKPRSSTPAATKPKRGSAAGTAPGGGLNFQAAVTAIAGTHVLRGVPLNWLPGVVSDIPVAVAAETGGPGDDLRLELGGGETAEVQAKKGLQRGAELWDALLALARGVSSKSIDYGVLAVDPESSRTIRRELAADIQRLAGNRTDSLKSIGREFLDRLEAAALSPADVCGRLRLVVVHALDNDDVGVSAAKEKLRHVCARELDADKAWLELYGDAHAIIERRRQWTLSTLTRLLTAAGVDIRDAGFPAGVAAKLSDWAKRSASSFQLPGLRKLLPLEGLLPLRTVSAAFETEVEGDVANALARYHSTDSVRTRAGDRVFDGEWTGRFYHRAVVVAGPGLGKSTLATQLAHRYARDGYPVLRVSLKTVASAMRNGVPFASGVMQWGLDGSGIAPETARSAGLREWVLIGDGLDDCGDQHEAVADGLAAFAAGHPHARVIVTTRPIGYGTAKLSAWRHYRLLGPEEAAGAANLALLIKAGAAPGAVDDALALAKRELDNTAAKAPITASPQLLAMAASLLLQTKSLPSSRPALYQRMLGLFADSLNATRKPSDPSPDVCGRVLDVLGWLLTKDPLMRLETVKRECSKLLAPELGTTPLSAASIIGAAIEVWERVGLVEELHHRGERLLTFIHKTFGEFAAARHLVSMEAAHRRSELEGSLDEEAASEVIAFAGGLGLGDEIAGLLVERHDAGRAGQFERALRLLNDPDANISEDYAISLLKAAFEAIERGHDDDLNIGNALADLAETQPELVVRVARPQLEASDVDVRLTAWACVAGAGDTAADASALKAAVQDLLPHVSRAMSSSLLGGLRLSGKRDRDLIARIGLAALKSLPRDQMQDFLDKDLAHEAFETWDFQRRVNAILHAAGLRPDWEPPRAKRSAASMLAILEPPLQWKEASRATFRAVAEAVTSDAAKQAAAGPARPLVQFGALIRGIGFLESEASDVHAWTEAYDTRAVRETLRIFVAVSDIDAEELAREAAEVLRRIVEEAEPAVLRYDFPSVDMPPPAWSSVPTANPDRALVISALEHPSKWLVSLAAQILEHIPLRDSEAASLLASGRGWKLAAAAYVLAEQHPATAVDHILDRLEQPWVPGVNYLFRALGALRPPLSPRLEHALDRGLTEGSPRVAEAAAALADGLVDRGEAVQPNLLENGFKHWVVREEPTPRVGTVPDSPRATLLKTRLKLMSVADEELMGLLDDPRHDVCDVAEAAVLPRLAEPGALRDRAFTGIRERTVAPSFAAKAFQSGLLLNGDEVAELENLLTDPNGRWRRAGAELLRSPYFTKAETVERLERLSSDPESEIRARSRAMLRRAQGVCDGE